MECSVLYVVLFCLYVCFCFCETWSLAFCTCLFRRAQFFKGQGVHPRPYQCFG
ncbi:hypothetical protein HanRHA438_Chr12g0562151 [Helianthus annuus]|nr:hypothetical protein HanIR_Chr12g0594481 [Helianthus annuus]KAJ0867349.1 hypothetical protein HanRHA438_Chr12g0562151 [Helianthus annuus]